MGHNIVIRDGKACFVENARKHRAWHKLGTVYDRPLTVQEALHGCHADYKVALQPLALITPDIRREMDYGSVMALQLNNAIVPKYMATMRLDTHQFLGIVTEDYGIVQNEDAFKFIDTLVTGKLTDAEHTPVIETAGVLGKGERVFITAKFPEQIILDNKGNDRVEMYIVFTTSHDGTGAVNCLVTPIRVVCNNTLNFAMRNHSGKLSLRHSRNVMDRLDLRESENAEFVYKTLGMYDVYKNLGPLGVLDYLDYVWSNTTNDDASIRKLENNLLAVAVYFDFEQDWLNKYSICTSPFYWWFNDTNKHRPARNKDYMEMKYRYFRLYIVSLLDN